MVTRKIAIVVPTIRPELMTSFYEAWEGLFVKHNVEYIVVTDGDVPYILHHDKHYIDTDLIQHHYTGVVNLGYAYVAQNLPDVEYIMTFHDDETPIGDPIQDHIDTLNLKLPISWFSPTTEYMRGFPYEVREESPVMFSHGGWKGIPDMDAPTQLLNPHLQTEFYKGAIPKGAFFPLCGMNLAFKREALPYVYFAPVAEYKGAERFDDIWGGIELKKDFDKFGWAIATGYSFVQHNRASNVYSNLSKEHIGIERNERYWKGEYDSWYNNFIIKREKWKKFIEESL